MTQLIIIRGNSGSGKSSVAKAVRAQLSGKTALIEQDYFRRIILKERDNAQDSDILDFLFQSVQFAVGRGYTVILEGILYSEKYSEMLLNLTHEFSYLAFYMDVTFEETLCRHKSKPNCHEFGHQEMKEWFVPKDYLGVPKEIIIPEKSSLNSTVKMLVEKYNVSNTNP